MKKKSTFSLLVACFLAGAVNAQTLTLDSFTVYLFLLEDCKITRAYTDRLSEIYAEYSGHNIGFEGLFPNPISNDSTIAEFEEKYQIPFPCHRQQAIEKAVDFKVSVTPEVVLFNETSGKILYQGRIDNMFERIGERRTVVTSFELEAALYCVRNHKEVPILRTQAVGCYLSLPKG